MKSHQLTQEQRESLEEIWFIYGNHGPNHSMRDHKFIQHFLEHGKDSRHFYLPSYECMKSVDDILNNPR